MKIKIILQALFWRLIEALDLLPENIKDRKEKRKASCNRCPLKAGAYCSDSIGLKLPHEIDNPTLTIAPKNHASKKFEKGKDTFQAGCGCLLSLKQLSTDTCPMNKWRK